METCPRTCRSLRFVPCGTNHDDRHGPSESCHMNVVRRAGASGVELATVSSGCRVSPVWSFFLTVELLEPTDPQIHTTTVAGRVFLLSGLSFRSMLKIQTQRRNRKRSAAAHAAKVDGDADDEPDDPTLTMRQRQAPDYSNQDLEDRDGGSAVDNNPTVTFREAAPRQRTNVNFGSTAKYSPPTKPAIW